MSFGNQDMTGKILAKCCDSEHLMDLLVVLSLKKKCRFINGRIIHQCSDNVERKHSFSFNMVCGLVGTIDFDN